jgi:hypothetical protein
MHNLNRESELELARFGEYLLKSRIVAEKHARYYVAWVRRFLSQVPGREGVTLEDRLTIFIENLNVEDWQLDQAEKAVRLYFTNYMTDSGTTNAITLVAPEPSGSFRKTDVLDAVRKLIQLRHYSYRTEQTYLDWLNRFFRYFGWRFGQFISCRWHFFEHPERVQFKRPGCNPGTMRHQNKTIEAKWSEDRPSFILRSHRPQFLLIHFPQGVALSCGMRPFQGRSGVALGFLLRQ